MSARPPSLAPTATEGRLRVFISSTMAELADLRERLAALLQERGLNAFVFEAGAGARPGSVVATSLEEVDRSEVYVGVFWKRYGPVTIDEYRRARNQDKPCFVYVRDRLAPRDPDLEKFLKDEVYSLARGVTYSFFDKLEPMVSQAADDVMKWLVTRHREMSAALADAQGSASDLLRLQQGVARLKSISRDPLPSGTAVDSLAHDLRGWFRTLGYGIEKEEVERTQESFEWMINVPARRGFDRVLVRGMQGEVQLGDLNLLESAVAASKADEGWLVTRQRISQAVRTKLKADDGPLYCYTVDELIDQTVDFNGYLQWLEREVGSRGIDRAYVSVAAGKKEFDTRSGEYLGESRYDGSNGWLEGYIDRWLEDPSKEHVSILGEFGTGKTWFAMHYAYVVLQRYKAAKERGGVRPRLPLVIPLRDYAKAVTVESLFSEFFFRKYEIPLPGYSAFEQLNRMGKLLLIFDGFDEMASRVDRQQMINNFWELARVVVPGSKAILTCRTEHFPEAKEGRALLNAELKASTAKLTGEPPQFEVLELERFDDAQVRQLLLTRTNAATADLIVGNPQLLDLARRPVMIEFIIDALPEIEAGRRIDLSRIYFYATTRKMRRDIESGRTFTSLADKLFFLCEIAWEMISTERMSLNYRQFPDHLSNLFGSLVREQKDLDHWHYDMLRNSMLIRNADGDYQPAHRSLLEFFVAFKFAAELGLLAPDLLDAVREQSDVDSAASPRSCTWSQYFRRSGARSDGGQRAPLDALDSESVANLALTFGRQPLTKAVLDLMGDMLVDDKTVARTLAGLIEKTRDQTLDLNFLGGNAATLWLRRDRTAFRERDLSRTNLASADFTAADLTGCDLKGATLRSAQLVGTTLRRADLRRADVSEMLVLDATRVTAVAVSPDGMQYAAGHSDGTIKIYEMKSGAEVRRWQAHDGYVNVIRWHPDGGLIASGSSGDADNLALWSAATAESLFMIKAHEHWVIDIAFDVVRDTLITTGGMGKGPLRVWNKSGQRVARWDASGANQANRLSVSSIANLAVVSYWDRKREMGGEHALVRLSDRSIDTVRTFRFPAWDVLMAPDGRRFAASLELSSDSGVGIYDLENARLQHATRLGDSPKCFIESDEVLVVGQRDTLESRKARLSCHVSSTRDGASMAELLFGPGLPSNNPGERLRESDISYSSTTRVLVGGADDGTVRIWDARLWLTPEGLPKLPLDESRPVDLGAMLGSESAWPAWARGPVSRPAGGLVPNPEFGKLLRLQEQRVICDGLRLDDAIGLSTVVISGMPFTRQSDAQLRGRVLAWFVERGAEEPSVNAPAVKKPVAKKLMKSPAEKKVAAKKAVAEKSASKKTVVAKAPVAKKPVVKKAGTRKAAAKNAVATKTPAKRPAAKKAAATKPTAKTK